MRFSQVQPALFFIPHIWGLIYYLTSTTQIWKSLLKERLAENFPFRDLRASRFCDSKLKKVLFRAFIGARDAEPMQARSFLHRSRMISPHHHPQNGHAFACWLGHVRW